MIIVLLGSIHLFLELYLALLLLTTPVEPIQYFKEDTMIPRVQHVDLTTRPLWTFKSPGGLSSPAVTIDDKTKTRGKGAARGYLLVTTKSGFIFALDKSTGRIQWQEETKIANEQLLDKAPDIAIVYFDDPIPINNTVDNVGRDTSGLVWNKLKTFNTETKNHIGTYQESKWGVIVGGSYAFDGHSGLLLWFQDMKECISRRPTVARIDGSLSVVIGTKKVASVYAVDASTGFRKWMVRLDGGSVTPIAADFSHDRTVHPEANVFFLGTTTSPRRSSIQQPQARGCVYALRANSGEILWRYNPSPFASFLAEPSLHYSLNGSLNSVIVVSSGDKINSVASLHPLTGAEIWVLKLSYRIRNVVSKPLISTLYGVVVICGNEGSIIGVNAHNGMELWMRYVTKGIVGDPVIVKYDTYEVLYLASLDSFVHAIDVRNGSIGWSYDAKYPVLSNLFANYLLNGGRTDENGTEDIIYFSNNHDEMVALSTRAHRHFDGSRPEYMDSNYLTSWPSPSQTIKPFPIPHQGSVAPSLNYIESTVLPTPTTVIDIREPSPMPTSAPSKEHEDERTQTPTHQQVLLGSVATDTQSDASIWNSPLYIFFLLLLSFGCMLFVYSMNFLKRRTPKYTKVHLHENDEDFHENVPAIPRTFSNESVKSRRSHSNSFVSMLTSASKFQSFVSNKVYLEPTTSILDEDLSVESKMVKKYTLHKKTTEQPVTASSAARVLVAKSTEYGD